jgi:hypothetical protein
MARNFYYGKQADVVNGSANFAAMIAQNPSILGLTTQQATNYGVLDTVLQSAFSTAMAPETRTPVTIQQKNIALKDVRDMAVDLARIVYATPSVSDAQLISLGLLPRPTYGPVPVAMTPPFVEVISVMGRLVKIRIHSAAPDESRKPNGSIGAQVYTFVGPDAPTDPTQYQFQGIATRGICEISFPNSVASGATAWIAAAWISRRGIAGVACTPVPVTIQGGPVLAEVV